MIKAISVWQPWAQLIAEGYKIIETRTHERFKGLIGRTIAIHAAQKLDVNFYDITEKYLTEDMQRFMLNPESRRRIFENRGTIVCTVHVNLTRWLDMTDSKKALCDCYNNGNGGRLFGLFLDDVRMLKKPFHCKGQQGVFEIDETKLEF
jgi:hypothetical protein